MFVRPRTYIISKTPRSGTTYHGGKQGLSVLPVKAASPALRASPGLEREQHGGDGVAPMLLTLKREKLPQATEEEN